MLKKQIFLIARRRFKWLAKGRKRNRRACSRTLQYGDITMVDIDTAYKIADRMVKP